MKLVEIDDNNLSPSGNIGVIIDDNSYSKPRVMSTLDNVMNEILRAPITDSDKWKLYSQALQRYLNHSKNISKKNDRNISCPINNDGNKGIPVEENSFNFSIGDIPNQFDMSGVELIRDSLDSISQPSVRNFFERVRGNNISTSPLQPLPIVEVDEQPQQPKKRLPKKPGIRRVQPYRSNAGAATKKRRAETSLSADLSQIRPCKVTLQRVNWTPTTAR